MVTSGGFGSGAISSGAIGGPHIASGSITLGTTAGSKYIGVCLESNHGAGTIGVTKYQCVTDADAVYATSDANARSKGDTLDLAGATGAQGVTTSSNKEFDHDLSNY